MIGGTKNKVKKLLCAAIVTLALAGMEEARGSCVDSNSIVKDGIEYYIQTDKSVYNLGEDVEILYRITNLTDQEWEVMGGAPLRIIFVAPKDAEWFESIWQWFEPGPPGPTGLRLEPGRSTEINETWPQIDMQGTPEPGDDTQVPPGIYRITGFLFLHQHPTDTDVAVDVTIVPEPGSLILFVIGLPIANYINRRRRG